MVSCLNSSVKFSCTPMSGSLQAFNNPTYSISYHGMWVNHLAGVNMNVKEQKVLKVSVILSESARRGVISQR